MEFDAVATRGHHPTDTRHIPEEWTMRTDFQFWPPQKQPALIWLLVHMVDYQTQTQRRFSLQDYTNSSDGPDGKPINDR